MRGLLLIGLALGVSAWGFPPGQRRERQVEPGQRETFFFDHLSTPVTLRIKNPAGVIRILGTEPFHQDEDNQIHVELSRVKGTQDKPVTLRLVRPLAHQLLVEVVYPTQELRPVGGDLPDLIVHPPHILGDFLMGIRPARQARPAWERPPGIQEIRLSPNAPVASRMIALPETSGLKKREQRMGEASLVVRVPRHLLGHLDLHSGTAGVGIAGFSPDDPFAAERVFREERHARSKSAASQIPHAFYVEQGVVSPSCREALARQGLTVKSIFDF